MVSCIAIILVLVPQIILLGAPATGKATIAKMICSKLRTANLSPASLIEESESHLKNAVLEYQNKNEVRPQYSCSANMIDYNISVPFTFHFINSIIVIFFNLMS